MNYQELWGINRATNFKGKPSFWRVQHCGTGEFTKNRRGQPKRYTSERLATDVARDLNFEASEVYRLRGLCAAAYQFVGAHDGPVSWLDALSNAANGRPFCADLLPYRPQSVSDTERELQQVREWLRQYHENDVFSTKWVQKISAYFAALDQDNREADAP